MRTAAACLISLLLADATPKGATWSETRWHKGDFVAASNDGLDRVVSAGEAVGIRISGRGESCLLRRRAYALHLPCRLRFRVRWSDARFGAAYPSVHLVFNPPALENDWWIRPMTANGGSWADRRQSFLFHFSTDPAWKVYGMTESLESAVGRHFYSSAERAWIDVEIKLDGSMATVSADGKEVAHCKADLRGIRTFTYGIGDQTSTFVELDDIHCVEGR